MNIQKNNLHLTFYNSLKSKMPNDLVQHCEFSFINWLRGAFLNAITNLKITFHCHNWVYMNRSHSNVYLIFSGPIFFLHPLSGLQAQYFSILSSLHFFILVSRSVTPPWSRLPFPPLLGLEIVSPALGLITVLSRSMSVSFRGVNSLIRFLKDLMHTCSCDLCAYLAPKLQWYTLIGLLNAGYFP